MIYPKDQPFTMRDGAIAMHEMYLSYVEAGFTEEQALELIKEAIRPGS